MSAYAHESRADEATFSYEWCRPCNDVTQHLDGRCLMRQNHPRQCRDCGQPSIGGLCPACESAHDLAHELDGPPDEDWCRDR